MQPLSMLIRSRALPGVLLAGGVGLAAGFFACTSDEPNACPILSSECPAELPSYANEVAPIFAAHCNQCHNGEDPSGPWPLNNASDINDWASSIKRDLEDCVMPPPDSAPALSDADRRTLHVWLSCGAPNN